jgi:hypothetical protein
MDAELLTGGKNTIALTVVESVFKGDHYRTVGKNERGQTLVLNLKGKTRADERVILRLDRINLYCLSN